MAISRRQAEAHNTGTGVASLAATLGSTPVAGNVMYAFASHNLATSDATMAGWTTVATALNASGAAMRLFRKVCGASESATQTVTSAGGTLTCFSLIEFTGVDTATPEDVAASTNNGVTANAVATGVADVTTGSLLLAACADDSGATLTKPASMGNASNLVSGAPANLTTCDETSDTTSNRTFTNSATDWVTIMVRLRPAATTGSAGAPATPFMLPLTGLQIPGYPATGPMQPTGVEQNAIGYVTSLPITQFVNPLSLVMGPRIFPIPAPYVIPVFPTGGTVTFDASPAGATSVAADFVDTVVFAASPAGVGTITEAVANTVTFAAAPSGAGTITVAIANTVVFASSPAGTATVSAAQAVTVALNALVAGTATVVSSQVLANELFAAVVAGTAVLTADVGIVGSTPAVVVDEKLAVWIVTVHAHS